MYQILTMNFHVTQNTLTMNRKLLVVIPFRDREAHLREFIPYIHTQLNRQHIKFQIVVIEQDHTELFNRGLLCNIGFLEGMRNSHYVCFHDVDMICSSSTIDYSYSDIPLCLLRHRTKPTPMYNQYFGGITLFPHKIFKKVNGFSNDYWGWGCEDDDLRLRCVKSNIGVSYRDGYCKDLEIVDDNVNRKNNPNYKSNLDKLIQFSKTKNVSLFINNNGLTTSKQYYKVISKTTTKDYIRISTKVNRVNS